MFAGAPIYHFIIDIDNHKRLEYVVGQIINIKLEWVGPRIEPWMSPALIAIELAINNYLYEPT